MYGGRINARARPRGAADGERTEADGQTEKGTDGEKSACNAGDLGLIPGLERSPGKRKGYALQYSCLENPIDRGAWWATVHGVTKSRT